MMVKICGITNLDDALAAVEAGASALGFNFYPGSPRYVPVSAAQPILEVLPHKVLKVGVFVTPDAGSASEIAHAAGLDVIQIHGDSPEYPEGVRVWRAVRAAPGLDLCALDPVAEALLLDTPSDILHGGTGQTFDWALARGAGRRIVLAGGLDHTNVREAIQTALPWGVDACSRLESEPGRKDHNKMRQFIQAALA